MATIETGQVKVELNRRGESTWDIGTRPSDDALGPHIIIQKGTMVMYIQLSDDEISDLVDWGQKVLEIY